jgi:hypothetical protein
VTVNGALCSAGSYLDKPCVEVTVCTPDQVDCQVVSDVLLDTGSFGLRLFKQAISLSLPAVTTGGATVATCARFGDGSSDWGPLARAAVILGQEPAVQVPIQIVDASFGPPPAACARPDASPAVAGFNGILGIGAFLADCGPGCAASSANGVYFACSASGCAGYAAPEASQVLNPAALLGADGGGLVVHLPAVPAGGATSAEGEVRLGIASRSNNTPTGVTALRLDAFGEFHVATMGQSFAAFADTGSNGLFFTAPTSITTLPSCPSPLQAWYCPASTQAFDATASGQGAGSATVPITFHVANFMALLSGSAAVFDSDAGSGLPGGLFDFGLPFHLGRDVWIVFDGRSTALGTGPIVAF